jgi:hypothetical protein
VTSTLIGCPVAAQVDFAVQLPDLSVCEPLRGVAALGAPGRQLEQHLDLFESEPQLLRALDEAHCSDRLCRVSTISGP